jgi:hypothetical protein
MKEPLSQQITACWRPQEQAIWRGPHTRVLARSSRYLMDAIGKFLMRFFKFF